MSKKFLHIVILSGMIFCCALSTGCTPPWPDSPLYDTPVNDPSWSPPATVAEAMAALEGHYAHYDIVAYIASGAHRTDAHLHHLIWFYRLDDGRR